MHKIPDGFLAVADKAYRGEPGKVSHNANPLDDPETVALKNRIRARQETFFARVKSFKVIENRFGHKPVLDKHKLCFEAVSVLVQYDIDLGNPLFAL